MKRILFYLLFITMACAGNINGNPFEKKRGNIEDLEKLRQTGACVACNLRGFHIGEAIEDYQEKYNNSSWVQRLFLNRQINLKDADLKNCKFIDGQDMYRKHLPELDLTQANFSGANLTNATLGKATFEKADFSGANLTNIKCTPWTNFSRANFFQTNLSKAILKKSNFREANFTEANLTDANCEESNFSEAKIKNALCINTWFKNANLARTNFKHSNLTNATLSGNIIFLMDLRNTIGAQFDNSKPFDFWNSSYGSKKTKNTH